MNSIALPEITIGRDERGGWYYLAWNVDNYQMRFSPRLTKQKAEERRTEILRDWRKRNDDSNNVF